MKRIEAVVRRDRLSEVKRAMAAVPHLGLTACDTTEQDSQGGAVLLCRGTKWVDDMAPRVSISVLVDEADAGAAVDAIVGAARTGHQGDGTIVVVPVEEVVHISGGAAVA
jgi:nitrogen regulatory protein PII